MSMGNEPDITVNGVKLTTPQSMTIRVALGIFMLDLAAHDFGPLGPLYAASIGEIEKIMGKKS